MIENAAGLDNASRRSASIDKTRCIYFEKSMMTDVLQAWPARLVPPPRGVMETSCALQSSHRRDDIRSRLGEHDAIRDLPTI